MNKKVYVLIPVYNVEKVVGDCFDSLIAQTYTNWEAIVVDDGSTDKSSDICDEYAELDSRIKVIHQKNGGLSMARRTAVNNVSDNNSYLYFLDSDDIIPNNSIKIMIDIAEKYDCDLVSGSFTKFINTKKTGFTTDLNKASNLKITEHSTIVKDLYRGFFGYGSFSVSLVSKLYKTDYFKKIYSKITQWPFYFGEDLNVTIRLVPEANRIATIDNIVYFYRYGGGTNKFIKSFVDDCILLYHVKKEHADKYGVSDYYKGLIEIEMKNLALHYLVMCIRTKTFPHGRIDDEIEYILNIPEFFNAIKSIPIKTLAYDPSEIQGFTQACIAKDTATVKKLAKKKANEKRLLRFIKGLI